MNPGLSIVIVTHNRPEQLARCLCSIARMKSDGLRYEVIIIMDSCRDDTRQVLESLRPALPFPMLVVPVNARRPGAARNWGARLARGSVLLFLDDDVTVSPTLALEHTLSQRDFDVVIGYLRAGFMKEPDWWQLDARIWWEDRFTAMREPSHTMCFKDFFSANVSIKTSLFHAIGGFDESLERQEDYELGLRLEKAGTQFTHNPRATATHWETGSVTRWVNRGPLEAESECRMGNKHPDSRRVVFHDRMERGDTRLNQQVATIRGLAFRRRVLLSLMFRLITISLPILEALKARQTWRLVAGAAHEYGYWRAIAGYFVHEHEFISWTNN